MSRGKRTRRASPVLDLQRRIIDPEPIVELETDSGEETIPVLEVRHDEVGGDAMLVAKMRVLHTQGRPSPRQPSSARSRCIWIRSRHKSNTGHLTGHESCLVQDRTQLNMNSFASRCPLVFRPLPGERCRHHEAFLALPNLRLTGSMAVSIPMSGRFV